MTDRKKIIIRLQMTIFLLALILGGCRGEEAPAVTKARETPAAKETLESEMPSSSGETKEETSSLEDASEEDLSAASEESVQTDALTDPASQREEMAESNEITEESESAMKIEEIFYITPITDEIFARIEGKSFKADCTLPREDLRYLHVLHKDLEGKTHEGEMIVNYHIAEDVLDILKQLYEADYPIEKIRLVDEYDADDERSMADNNSSSFNFRFISHTTKVSKHGLGLAVDINTLYNPYIKTVDGRVNLEPANASPYVDRTKEFPYKIDEQDLCYQLFCEKGFEWGGSWTRAKDYQHFEIPNERIREWYPEP